MRLPPSLRLAGILAAVLLTAYGCGDGPSAPVVQARAGTLGRGPAGDVAGEVAGAADGALLGDAGTTVDAVTEIGGVVLEKPMQTPVLRRNRALPRDLVAYALIWPGQNANTSQSVKIRDAGLAVHFPYNAVKKPTWVKVTAHAGDLVAYSLEPHGITFDTLIKVQQDLKYTTAYRDTALTRQLHGGYLPNGLADIDPLGIATITESFPIYYNESDPTGQVKLTPSVAKFYTNHFSGYIIATGRREEY
ncbi:MAG TPA: hypothetical protein VNA89_07230 [Gemmatimonadaceae bacterium]|nr:hypothetical protein [Gemmatimonadaceae bacterium]